MWHVTGQRRRAPTNLPSASTSLYFSAATNCKLQPTAVAGSPKPCHLQSIAAGTSISHPK